MRVLSSILFLLLLVPAANGEERKIDLLGEWRIRTVERQDPGVKGCRYDQWIVIRRKQSPTVYTGLVRSRFDCNGRRGAGNEKRIRVSVHGDRVTITAPQSADWIPEHLRYVSPTRMEGTDRYDHEIIYERPESPPTT